MLNIINYQRNANQNRSHIAPPPVRMAAIKKVTSVGTDVQKRDHSCRCGSVERVQPVDQKEKREH